MADGIHEDGSFSFLFPSIVGVGSAAQRHEMTTCMHDEMR